MAKVGKAPNWPKSVKELAKVDHRHDTLACDLLRGEASLVLVYVKHGDDNDGCDLLLAGPTLATTFGHDRLWPQGSGKVGGCGGVVWLVVCERVCVCPSFLDFSFLGFIFCEPSWGCHFKFSFPFFSLFPKISIFRSFSLTPGGFLPAQEEKETMNPNSAPKSTFFLVGW